MCIDAILIDHDTGRGLAALGHLCAAQWRILSTHRMVHLISAFAFATVYLDADCRIVPGMSHERVQHA